MFHTLASQIGLAITVLICAFTAWAGGRPQKVAATIVIVAWVGSNLIQDRSFRHPQYLTLVLDIGLTVLFVALAVKWRQLWLSGMATFLLLTTASHFAMILDSRIFAKASITAYLIWSYLVLVCLLWGGVAGLLDRRRPGPIGP